MKFGAGHVFVCLALALFLPPVVGAKAQSSTYKFVQSEEPLQDRNAYLLTLLASDYSVARALSDEQVLRNVGSRLDNAQQDVLRACSIVTVANPVAIADLCPIDRLELTDAEIDEVGEALGRLAVPGGVLSKLVRTQMRPSGRFQKYAGKSDADFMRAAWSETAHGINRLYQVYGLGQRFPLSFIDGMSRDPAEQSYQSLLKSVLIYSTDGVPPSPFFGIWSRIGFDLLTINQRDEAARYEPLDTGENAKSFTRARTIEWSKMPYSAIIVPGIGLEPGEVGVAPLGELRLRAAVKRWRAGLAPFIILSGGQVHPNRTPYTEAIEMKKLLLARYQVPEDAIVVDPYARHTTTNLRNASRLLFRMGAPMTQPAIIIKSSPDEYILSKAFSDRCQIELGYEPMTDMVNISAFELSAVPNLISLHADPLDPLDP